MDEIGQALMSLGLHYFQTFYPSGRIVWLFPLNERS